MLPILIVIGVLAIQHWYKSEKIRELEQIISDNNYYPDREEIKSLFQKNRKNLWMAYDELNDSLTINYTLHKDPVKTANDKSMLGFSVNLKSKLSRQIDRFYGELVVKDSVGRKLITLPVEKIIGEDESKLISEGKISFWNESWNLELYHPEIKEIFLNSDINDYLLDWKLKQVIFKDSSSILLTSNY
jgi:hypothetical protein